MPISLNIARQFVAAHHRHSIPPQGWLFGVGLELGGDLIAVATAGRPMGRGLQDGKTVEVTRVTAADDLDPRINAASRLYGAICRAAAALGYERAITYTLATEPGTSLRAAGFRLAAALEPRESWASDNRPRYDADLWGRTALNVARNRWERSL